jgi:putative hydrolase of the HAD superfamily
MVVNTHLKYFQNMKVRAVIFDLDGTLLDRESSIEQFVDGQYDRFDRHLSHISKIDYANRFIEVDCLGHVWKDKVYQTLVAEFNIDGIGWQELLADYESQFQFHCVPFPCLIEMLDALKQRGYLLGIITNGRGEFQKRAISGLGIEDYFDVILISEIEGMRKPQPEIFNKAMNQLGVTPENSFFVGDNPEADIEGAKNAKMRTIWKRNSHWLATKEADATIDDLSEILSVVNDNMISG